jgi:mycoredoxin
VEPKEMVVYGTNWCPACRSVKRYLDVNSFPYLWVDIENNEEGRSFVLKANSGHASVPTIVFPDGSIMAEPSMIALNKKFRPE